MAKVILGLGGNIGDTESVFAKALLQLNSYVTDTYKSSIYQSDPLLAGKQRYYLNMVISAHTDVPPKSLLEKCKLIEKMLGRTYSGKWGERIIDIDIIDYAGMVYHDKELTLPHREMTERSFVLYPLREIEPNYIHPINGKSAAGMIQELGRFLNIKKFKGSYGL